MTQKNQRGQPRAFEGDGDVSIELEKKMRAYLKKCHKQQTIPNIAGFCTFAKISRETYYQQRNYYPDTYKTCEAMLEDAVINSPAHHVLKIFYMKNKFGYQDKIQQEISTPEPLKFQNLDLLSVDELKALKAITSKMEQTDDTNDK